MSLMELSSLRLRHVCHKRGVVRLDDLRIRTWPEDSDDIPAYQNELSTPMVSNVRQTRDEKYHDSTFADGRPSNNNKVVFNLKETPSDQDIEMLLKWNEWKCSDLKCVRKPTRSRLSLTQHANKSSRWAFMLLWPWPWPWPWPDDFDIWTWP